MSQLSRRSTVYFDPQVHQALRLKAARENRSISDIVNEAVALLASEDAEDIADFDSRKNEPSVDYANFMASLKMVAVFDIRFKSSVAKDLRSIPPTAVGYFVLGSTKNSDQKRMDYDIQSSIGR